MNTDDLVPGCFACEQQAAVDLPPREDVVHTEHWRVAHAFNSMLPGWLVLLPTRLVTSFTQLTSGAADELGGLVFRLSAALEAWWLPKTERDSIALGVRAELDGRPSELAIQQ